MLGNTGAMYTNILKFGNTLISNASKNFCAHKYRTNLDKLQVVDL